MDSRNTAIRFVNMMLDMVYEDVNDHVRTTFCDDRGEFYNADVEELYRVMISCIEAARNEALTGTALDRISAQTSSGEPDVFYKYVLEERESAEPEEPVIPMDEILSKIGPDVRIEIHELWLNQLQDRLEQLEKNQR